MHYKHTLRQEDGVIVPRSQRQTRCNHHLELVPNKNKGESSLYG